MNILSSYINQPLVSRDFGNIRGSGAPTINYHHVRSTKARVFMLSCFSVALCGEFSRRIFEHYAYWKHPMDVISGVPMTKSSATISHTAGAWFTCLRLVRHRVVSTVILGCRTRPPFAEIARKPHRLPSGFEKNPTHTANNPKS